MNRCGQKTLKGGWVAVVFAAECDPWGEGLCPCGIDYAECCLAPGPTEDDVDYKTVRGVLYGRKKNPPTTNGGGSHEQ